MAAKRIALSVTAGTHRFRVDLVSGRVDKCAYGRRVSDRLKQMDEAEHISVEIFLGFAITASDKGLRGEMEDHLRLGFVHSVLHERTVAQVHVPIFDPWEIQQLP